MYAVVLIIVFNRQFLLRSWPRMATISSRHASNTLHMHRVWEMGYKWLIVAFFALFVETSVVLFLEFTARCDDFCFDHVGHWHNNFRFNHDEEWLQCTTICTCIWYGVFHVILAVYCCFCCTSCCDLGGFGCANEIIDTTIFASIVVNNGHDAHTTAPGCLLSILVFGACDYCGLLFLFLFFLLWFGGFRLGERGHRHNNFCFNRGQKWPRCTPTALGYLLYIFVFGTCNSCSLLLVLFCFLLRFGRIRVCERSRRHNNFRLDRGLEWPRYTPNSPWLLPIYICVWNMRFFWLIVV